MRNLTFVFILAIIFTNSCTNECFRHYYFDYHVKIYPINDTINVGDTLWVEMNLENMVEDGKSGELIDISNLHLHFELYNIRYDIIDFTLSASDFDYHIVDGDYQLTEKRSFILFNAPNNKKFKVGMIPKSPGGQVILVSNRASGDEIELEDECIESIEQTNFFINNDGERNLHLLDGLYNISEVGDTLSWGTGEELYKTTSAYAFYVQE